MMKPFPTPEHYLRPGETRLHIYALPTRDEQPALFRLIDRAGAVCARFGGTNVPVREEWLHATVRMVSLDARGIDSGQRAALVEALGAGLADLEPFTLHVSELTATDAGVMLGFDDDADAAAEAGTAWHRMSVRVREAIGRSCGPGALGFEPGPPHVSLTYCSHETDSAPIQEALRAAPHAREPFHVDALHLVDVLQDADAHAYTWRHLARIPLG
ncbi:MAG TPA: 2'-5' RNA ligase family protein [Actinocrinis sp.]|nr:2'-5' RNA ligase family protein [Actinocrinis sp.]